MWYLTLLRCFLALSLTYSLTSTFFIFLWHTSWRTLAWDCPCRIIWYFLGHLLSHSFDMLSVSEFLWNIVGGKDFDSFADILWHFLASLEDRLTFCPQHDSGKQTSGRSNTWHWQASELAPFFQFLVVHCQTGSQDTAAAWHKGGREERRRHTIKRASPGNTETNVTGTMERNSTDKWIEIAVDGDAAWTCCDSPDEVSGHLTAQWGCNGLELLIRTDNPQPLTDTDPWLKFHHVGVS